MAERNQQGQYTVCVYIHMFSFLTSMADITNQLQNSFLLSMDIAVKCFNAP